MNSSSAICKTMLCTITIVIYCCLKGENYKVLKVQLDNSYYFEIRAPLI